MRSIPIKLRAIRTPNTFFIIVHDKDSNDCKLLKDRLVHLCKENGRPDTLVRIVCHELESWFLGDLNAVEKAFGSTNLSSLQNKAKYRDPDQLANPVQELKKLVRDYQKLSGSREISKHINVNNNHSRSFNVFLAGIEKMILKNTQG